MGKLVPFGQKKQWDVSGDIAGISFNTYLFGAANNTTPTGADFDAKEVSLTIAAFFGGQEFPIYSGPLNVVAMESSFRDAMYLYSNPKVFGASVELVTAGAGNPGEIMVPMVLDFGTILNCKGADKIRISVQTDRKNLGASIDSTASYIDVDIIEGVGYGTFIPVISVQTITNGDQTFDFTLGNKIQGLTILDTDHHRVLQVASTSPWKSINLSSDKLKVQDAYIDLLLKRIAQFPTDMATTAMNRGYSFQLYALNIPLNNVRIQGVLAPANVANSACLVVSRSQVSSPAMYARAMAKREQHRAQNNRTTYGI